MRAPHAARTDFGGARGSVDASLPSLRPCKALVVDQPWATIIAARMKRVVTLRYPTMYRGPLAICASRISSEPGLEKTVDSVKGLLGDDHSYALVRQIESFRYPLGAVICIGTLVSCEQITLGLIAESNPAERALGDWQVGRYAWRVDEMRPIEPYPMHMGKEAFADVEVPW